MADFDDDGKTFRRPTPFRQSGAVGAEPLDATARRPTPMRPSHSEPLVHAGLEDTVDSKKSPLPGDDVIDGRYRVLERLAAGGMGEVFKVEHIELGRRLALKLMLPALSQDQEFLARFKTEAVAVSRIGHPNIIDVTDFGRTADGRFYFVMELLEGLTLASVLHRQGPMPAARVAKVGAQIARALAAAHSVGIVHRDLKPENVMLVRRGETSDVVKVLDFGVAKVHASAGGAGQTVAGLVVGTPMYMSPEQARAVAVDHRTDLYSLGLILYELVTGRTPFTGETPSIIMVKQVTEQPPPLESLIFKLLQKHPEARPESMKEVAEALETLDGSGAAQTASKRPTAPDTAVEVPLRVERSRLPMVLAALVVVGLGAGAVLAFREPPPQPPVAAAPPPVAPLPPVPTPAPVLVAVTIASTPSGAEVSTGGGVLLGSTPVVLRRAPQTELTLSLTLAGFQPQTRSVIFEDDRTVTIPLPPLPTVPAERPTKKAVKRAGPAPGQDLQDDPYQQTDDLKELPLGE
jgi:eukaryotic-like serine/threonine-protein kinase